MHKNKDNKLFTFYLIPEIVQSFFFVNFESQLKIGQLTSRSIACLVQSLSLSIHSQNSYKKKLFAFSIIFILAKIINAETNFESFSLSIT